MKKKTKRQIFLDIITFRWLFKGLVIFYKKVISPCLPNVCIYTPTCSTYMMQSIEKFGVIRGGLRGLWRIMRCNPWSKGGFDPVPDNPKGDMKWLF